MRHIMYLRARMASMRRKVLAVVALVVALAACNKTAERPGDPAVYKRIDALSDCKALQAEFDVAAANHDRASTQQQREWTTAYMAAADDRMRAVGCYK